jgi:DNA ligase (NAD+)
MKAIKVKGKKLRIRVVKTIKNNSKKKITKKKTLKIPKKYRRLKIRVSKNRKIEKIFEPKNILSSKSKMVSLNEKFIDLLSSLEDLMKMKGEGFRARAYHKAMETVMAFPGKISSSDELKGQPGIGDTILKKFKEFQETGTLKLLEREKGLPRYIFAKIYGVGPKRAQSLVDKDGITTIKELRENPDLLNNVQKKGLKYYEDILQRIPRNEIVKYEKVLDKAFKKVSKKGDRFEIVGSYRRGAKTSGDIDIIITNDKDDREIFGKFIDELEKEKILVELLSKGATKSLTIGKLPKSKIARRLDFMYARPSEYAFSTLYFTGSKAFNVVQRQRAIDMGYTMNEHGLFHLTGPKKKKKGDQVKGDFPNEKAIFDFLGMVYKGPTERKTGSSVVLKKSPKSKSLKKKVKAKRVTLKVTVRKPNILKNWGLVTDKGFSEVKKLNEQDLCNMVRLASDAYYNKTPVVSDNVFDIVKEFGQRTYPNNPCFDEVGAPTNKSKVKLPYEMHSMDKIKPDTKALPKYKKKYPGPKVISGKLDGISVLYTGGKLYTRGRSSHGMDISYLVPYLDLPPKKNIAIRGELLIDENKFIEKYSAKYKNSRNMVSGVVNSKKREPEKWKDLDFVGYEVIVPELKPSEQMKWLLNNGVVTVLHETSSDISNEMLSEILVDWRETYRYEIDGIIVNDDKIHPRRNKNPDHAFAFKMVLNDQMAEVKVVDVIWTASKDGYLNPVVQVEPVNIRGADIEFATAHNAKFILENKIGIGAIIQLIRSGDVIPKIQAVIQPAEKAQMPTIPWKWNESHVDAMLKDIKNNPMVLQKSVEFFFSKLDIKGVGPGNVKKMINAGFNTIPKILKMTKTDLLTVDGFKEKTANKIRKNITETIKNSSLVMIASASNIFGRGLGSSIIRNIIHEFPNIIESGEDMNTKIDQISGVENVGKKRAKLFVKNIPTFLEFMAQSGLSKKLKEQVGQNIDKNHILFEKRIVMTGFRDKPLKKTLIELGAKVGTTIGPTVFAVLVKDIDEQTSKADEARLLGIPLMLPEDFRKKYI